MIQLNFSLGGGGGCSSSIRRCITNKRRRTFCSSFSFLLFFFFRYVPLAPLRSANIKKKRRVELFLALLALPISIVIRIVRRDSWSSLKNSKNPACRPSFIVFLVFFVCYRWVDCLVRYNDIPRYPYWSMVKRSTFTVMGYPSRSSGKSRCEFAGRAHVPFGR